MTDSSAPPAFPRPHHTAPPGFAANQQRFIHTLAAVGLFAGSASAQDRLSNVEQNTLSRETAGEIGTAPAHRLSHPEIGEIGLINRHPVPDTLTIYTSQSTYVTDNAFLAPRNESSDLFWNGVFGLTYVPYSVRDITPSLNLEQSYFRYDEFEQLDFDSLTLRAALKYDFDRNDTLFSVTSYGFTRLHTSRFDAGEFYKYGLLTQSFTKILKLGDPRLFLSSSFGATYRHGDPSALDRMTAFGAAGLFYLPEESFSASLFVRPEGQFYPNDPARSDRFDLNLAIGLSAMYRFTDDASLSASLQYVGNYSNAPSRDYRIANLGLSLSLKVAF